jgi:predicted Zn-dependent protease
MVTEFRMIPSDLERRFREALPSGLAFASLRALDERNDTVEVRDDVVQPSHRARTVGGMVTVHHGGGLGYAATPDLSVSGLRRALAEACDWASRTTGRATFDPGAVAMPSPRGEHRSVVPHSSSDS